MNVKTLSLSPRTSTDTVLSGSLGYCRALARTHARNFYYGMMLTPEPRRSALYAIYAWMRHADDLADGSEPIETRRLNLEQFRQCTVEAIEGKPPAVDSPVDHRLWPAIRRTVEDYEISPRYFHEMIDGQWMDQERSRYEHFDALRRYCYHVASTVGLVCISIWGYKGGQETRELAIKRGMALQLTNILRDVAEDAQRGRIYLPQDDLQRYDLDEDSLLAMVNRREADERFERLMHHQVERARSYYDQSAMLEDQLQPACRATCWSMMRIYRGLLDRIAADPAAVLHSRLGLSCWSKLAIAFSAAWHRGGPR
ncbi:MAG: phytoene/squalene synthase family protein [Phycisphaeraceae bacterium]|nr:phytoene/squalene synthase family protein [Phycisphaeraceae bacterium]